MEEAFIQNALDYAASHRLQLAERLGFGVHGIIYAAENKAKATNTAIKAFRELEPYLRERDVYERLKSADVTEILGFNVPELIRADDDLCVIEMSIVRRPFVLDFAGAYLDSRPTFTPEIWAEWEAGKREQFDARWPIVQNILAALEELDIFMVDVSPTNIAFVN